jgi:hypothetical protein
MFPIEIVFIVVGLTFTGVIGMILIPIVRKALREEAELRARD